MTQFATADEFAARIGVTLTTDEQTRADTLLALASGVIQQETKQKIVRVTDDEFVIRSTYRDRIRLPQRPVVSVAGVVLQLIGGAATFVVPANTFYIDRDEIVRTAWPLSTQYAFAAYARGWLGPLYQATITYTHGFADDAIPEIVKVICLEMVVRVWVNPGSVARETVGDTMTVYDNNRFSPSGMLLTDVERDQLFDLLRRHTTTAALR